MGDMGLPYAGRYGEVARVTRVAGIASKLADLVHDGVRQVYHRQTFAGEAQWRAALREMSQEARADSVPAEKLLIEVKQALGILLDACAIRHGPARTEFTNRVVTLCIEEYFRTAAQPAGADEARR